MDFGTYFEAFENIKQQILVSLSALPLYMQIMMGSTMALGSYKLLNNVKSVGKPTVSVIRLEGTIMTGGGGGGLPMGRPQLINLDVMKGVIDRAFSQPNLKLVCLVVNSPGGSPVQSDLVFRYLKRASEQKKVEMISFVEDVAASGGYWLACAGSQIYATKSSMVGSIGVINAGFGFHEIIKRVGIERRVYTAGKNKAIMDPFKPVKDTDMTIMKNLLNSTHKIFVEHVKTCRGERLPGGNKEIFSGEFWTGEKAAELGLVDGIDNIFEFLDRKFGGNVTVYEASRRPSMIGNIVSRLMPVIPFFKDMETCHRDVSMVEHLCKEQQRNLLLTQDLQPYYFINQHSHI